MFLMERRPPRLTRTGKPFPYRTLFRSRGAGGGARGRVGRPDARRPLDRFARRPDLSLSPARGGSLPQWRAADRRRRRLVAEPLSRSEEHTSELQSLMRISYAVFCLHKNYSSSHYYYLLYSITMIL